MADNPFANQVNQLNGVVLQDGAVARAGNASYIVADQSDFDTITVSYAYSAQISPGTITILDSDYIPSSMNGDEHIPPSFGHLTLSGFTPALSTSFTSFKIIGFDIDGTVLITPYSNISIEEILAGEINYNILALTTDGIISDRPFPITFETNPAAICFAEGTRIETAEGQVAVEDLVAGDMVRTASGAVRTIKWIGMQIANPGVHRRPQEVNPVLVRAHAFGPDMPSRDVRLSPGHAVFVDGVLVPVGYLVNGATIVQLQVETIRYYHVELDSHDVLLAEGLPCESYLDDGNRLTFINSGDFTQLHGRLDPQNWDKACAPMVGAGPQLIDIRLRLHAIAEGLGWQKSEEPDLRLVVDGVEVGPLHRIDTRYWFPVPATEAFALRSSKAVLAQVMPGLSDTRMLGVAVSEVRIDGTPVALDDAAFGTGFYPAEHHETSGWRWTDGDATIARPIRQQAMIEVQLAMVAPSWRAAVPRLRIVA